VGARSPVAGNQVLGVNLSAASGAVPLRLGAQRSLGMSTGHSFARSTPAMGPRLRLTSGSSETPIAVSDSHLAQGQGRPLGRAGLLPRRGTRAAPARGSFGPRSRSHRRLSPAGSPRKHFTPCRRCWCRACEHV